MIYIDEEQKKRICDTLKVADCSIGLLAEAIQACGKELDFQNDCCDEADMEKIKAYIVENKEK